jgi:predicted metalloprotease
MSNWGQSPNPWGSANPWGNATRNPGQQYESTRRMPAQSPYPQTGYPTQQASYPAQNTGYPQYSNAPYASAFPQQAQQQTYQQAQYPYSTFPGYQAPKKKRVTPMKVIGFTILLPIAILLALLLIQNMASEEIDDPIPPTPTQPDPTEPEPIEDGINELGADGYFNEDLPIPAPGGEVDALEIFTYEQAERALLQSPMYDLTLPVPVYCELGGIDASTASSFEMETYLNDLTECLHRVWAPNMEEAGLDLPRPEVTVYSSTIQSACGQMETGNAFYCASDSSIFYATDLPNYFTPDMASHPFFIAVVMSHEFGHMLQHSAGILEARSALAYEAETEAEYNEYLRRTELQADCFEGLSMQADAKGMEISQSEYSDLGQIEYQIGDDMLTGDPNVDGGHGRGASRETWGSLGRSTTDIGECNTWVVPSSEVK